MVTVVLCEAEYWYVKRPASEPQKSNWGFGGHEFTDDLPAGLVTLAHSAWTTSPVTVNVMGRPVNDRMAAGTFPFAILFLFQEIEFPQTAPAVRPCPHDPYSRWNSAKSSESTSSSWSKSALPQSVTWPIAGPLAQAMKISRSAASTWPSPLKSAREGALPR